MSSILARRSEDIPTLSADPSDKGADFLIDFVCAFAIVERTSKRTINRSLIFPNLKVIETA
jgi:hypothetical protein